MKVLFVCTGNTCRSPMAAGIAKKMCPPNWEVLSAGISILDGDQLNPKAADAMKDMQIDIADHNAIALDEQLIVSTDYIVTMTKRQADLLVSQYPHLSERIKRIGDWVGIDKDISDPWGRDLDTYKNCAQELQELVEAFVQKYCKQE